jgi:hypothetical protein
MAKEVIFIQLTFISFFIYSAAAFSVDSSSSLRFCPLNTLKHTCAPVARSGSAVVNLRAEWLSATGRVRVRAPMQTVWDLWSNIENLPEWQVHSFGLVIRYLSFDSMKNPA